MKYYRFNRDRSYTTRFGRLMASHRKLMYMVGTNRSRLLNSCYFESETWGALHKAWKGYKIAKNKYEVNNLFHYAEIIQKLQSELGLQVSSFPSLGLQPRKQDHNRSEDYDPSEEEFDNILRSEQTCDPSEEFDSIMRSEQG